MSMSRSDRVEHLQSRPNRDAPDDDRVVLRLSREMLRAEPPVVQFVDRINCDGQPQKALWPA